MKSKEEALKLADELLRDNTQLTVKSAHMIRRLVEELDKQGSSIWDSTRRVYENCQCDSCKNKEPQTKPLSDGEIDESFDRTASHMANEYVSHYEPTAWINHIKQTGGDFYELNVSGRGEPLYRHPPQTKSLSDEEIEYYEHLIAKLFNCSTTQKIIGLDRVIRAIEERHGIK